MTSLVESFFGLKRPAFSVSESSGPVLMTRPVQTVANFLRRRIDTGANVLCVTGPPGIGKSSVARALAKLTGERFRVAMMSGRAQCWDDLRRVLTREFGIEEGRITRSELVAARAKLGPLLIAVDDAQFLSPKLLERICILPQLLTQAGQPVVQVVLFADLDAVPLDEIRRLRAWFDLDTQIVMEPLPPTDVHSYTDKRLRRVGWSGRPLFSESGALALHRISLGNPRRLSAVCMETLERAASRGLTQIEASLVMECAEDCAVSKKRDEIDRENLPLTAENIAAAPSLELEIGDFARHDGDVSEAELKLESIRAVARSVPSSLPAKSRPAPPRRFGPRPMVMALWAMGAALALYASRIAVAGVLPGGY